MEYIVVSIVIPVIVFMEALLLLLIHRFLKYRFAPYLALVCLVLGILTDGTIITDFSVLRLILPVFNAVALFAALKLNERWRKILLSSLCAGGAAFVFTAAISFTITRPAVLHFLTRTWAEEGAPEALCAQAVFLHEGVGGPGDAAKGRKLAEMAAEQGNADCQHLVGRLYADGEGFPQDIAKGVKWLRLAAAQGETDAQADLGNILFANYRDEPTLEEGVKWLSLAAKKGVPRAQYLLAQAHSRAWGTPKDIEQAAAWASRAAFQGHAEAQYLLGLFRLDGDGVPQNYARSYKWLSLAAAAGHKEARELVTELESEMTPEEISAGKRLAEAFRKVEEASGVDSVD
ncbi:MAG: tetratricopeptide repeat protein [Elusimicrobiota bacterium]